jgi:hypothetical protein
VRMRTWVARGCPLARSRCSAVLGSACGAIICAYRSGTPASRGLDGCRCRSGLDGRRRRSVATSWRPSVLGLCPQTTRKDRARHAHPQAQHIDVRNRGGARITHGVDDQHAEADEPYEGADRWQGVHRRRVLASPRVVGPVAVKKPPPRAGSRRYDAFMSRSYALLSD